MSVLFVKQWSSVSDPIRYVEVINVSDLYLARWKARSRLPIGCHWTYFLALTAEASGTKIRRNRRLLKGVTLRLNIRLKGYIYSQHLHTPLDRGMCYYYFATSSFYTKKLYSRLHSIQLEFYSQKMTYSLYTARPHCLQCRKLYYFLNYLFLFILFFWLYCIFLYVMFIVHCLRGE